MKTSVVIVFVLLPCVAIAWSVTAQHIIKHVISFGAATTISMSPLLSANAVDMSGSYSDPFHPNCLRIISVDGNKAYLKGTDGNPSCPPDGSGTEWKLTGKIESPNVILVDFTPKGGPKDLRGEFDGRGISWPDGNKWTLKTN